MKYRDYEEKRTHGDRDFALCYYPPEPNSPESSMPLHWHRECELIRVTEGELQVFLDSKEHIGKLGDVFFLPSGVLHRAEPQSALYECAVFSPDILYGRKNERVSSYIMPFVSGESEALHFSLEKAPDLCCAAEDFFRTVEKQDEFFELTSCGKLLEVFHLLLREIGESKEKVSKISGRQKANVTELLRWIDKSFAEKITLSDMAAVINVNEQYLCKIFKEFTGSTPIDYLNEVRIAHACFEMSANHRNATEAAYETGFCDLSYFSKVFRKYKGMSPTEYRKSLK